MKRAAGLVLPLFSLRTRHDWGIGEISDLPLAGRFARSAGFSWLQVLPPHELGGDETSPYGARTAFAIDPVYIALAHVPGSTPELLREAIGASGEAELAELRRLNHVDYTKVRRLKRAALSVLTEAFVAGPLRSGGALAEEFAAFTSRESAWLDDFARYVALWNAHQGHGWETWPSGALADPAAVRDQKVLQFFAERQWRAAKAELHREGVSVMGDVPFIVGAESADVWGRQGEFRRDISLGCPPDPFSADGQDWSLPAYDVARMEENDFAFLRARTRRAKSLYDAFRLDHVIGYFRMWLWDRPPLPREGRFDVTTEEAQQARGEQILRVMIEEAGPEALIAEDLGVIPDFVRSSLRRLGIPGYKVIPWERRDAFHDPRGFDPLSVATFSTHDTPPITMWWSELPEDQRAELAALARFPPDAPERLRQEGLYHLLAESGSSLVLMLAEEVLGEHARVNVPGTVGPHNWSLRLPMSLEDLQDDAEARSRVEALHKIFQATGRA